MTFTELDYTLNHGVGLVHFNRPKNLNSLTETVFTEMEAVLDHVESDPAVRALVITGEGKAFCVGLDLSLLERAFDDMGYFEAAVRRLSVIITRLEALPIPTTAAINGYARAGGFELALACDFIVIAEEALIGDAHTDAGVLPAVVSLRLRRRVGEQRAKDILWTARWLTASEAVAYGLALRAYPLATLTEDACAFARTMTDKPAAAIASLKRLFIEGADLDVEAGTEFELKSFVRYMSSEPYGREGYYAFREKRQPAWRTSGGMGSGASSKDA